MSKSYISKKLRKFVAERAKGHCEYCLMPSDFSPTLDLLLLNRVGNVSVHFGTANRVGFKTDTV